MGKIFPRGLQWVNFSQKAPDVTIRPKRIIYELSLDLKQKIVYSTFID